MSDYILFLNLLLLATALYASIKCLQYGWCRVSISIRKKYISEQMVLNSAELLLEGDFSRSNLTGFQWLRGLGYPVRDFNASTDIIFTLSLEVAKAIKSGIDFRSVYLSEEWVCDAIKCSSDRGRYFLARKINSQERINLFSAVKWLVNERH